MAKFELDRRAFIKTTFLASVGITGCKLEPTNSRSESGLVQSIETPEMSAAVHRVVRAIRKREGAGFEVRRPFPIGELSLVDPFILLDEMGPSHYGPGEAVGAPDHPHRGFETVTYMLQGELEHRDSMGHEGFISGGGVQWMTAGRGVVHSEMPHKSVLENGGTMHGFQLWVNLPKKMKMMPPHYQELQAQSVPILTTAAKDANVRIISGEALGVKGQIQTHTPVTYQHWTLHAGAEIDFPIERNQRAAAYLFKNDAFFGTDRVFAEEGAIVLFSEGDVLRLEGPKEGTAELLLMAGVPLNEPIARRGPFVMNTMDEIHQAYDDYRAGRMGRIPPG